MRETVPEVAKHAPDLISSFLTGMPLIERLVLAGLDKEHWFEEVIRLASEKPLGTLEQTRIISLYASALQAISKIRPILLILEDIHWIDASSAALFNYLSRHAEGNQILLIGSYRSSDVLTSKSQHPVLDIGKELHRLYGDIEINLEEKKIEEEREFVNAYLDSKPNELDNNFRETFFKHTQGHALFTAELLNTMKERGDLYRQGGKWLAKDTIDWQKLPSKVEGVIEVRISRLPKEQRQLLSVASVQGETFVGEAIAQVQKQDEREVIRAFSNEIDKRHKLVQSERMERLGKQRLSHYRFRHNLFQQYVYNNLAEVERNYLHEDIALALEKMYGEKAKGIAPQLAWNFEQAGNIEKTFEYLLVAGQQAQALGSNKEAISHYERGLAIVSQLPPTSELIPVELGFQAGLGMALLPVEGYQSEKVRIALERALELCRQIGANPQFMPIYSGLSHYAFAKDGSSHKIFLEWASEFEVMALKQEDSVHIAAAAMALIVAHFVLGNNDKAIEVGRSILNQINFDKDSHENMIRYYTYDQRVAMAPVLSWALWYKGKVKEAKTLIASEPMTNFKHAASRAFFLGMCLVTHQFMKNAIEIKRIAEELLQIADEYGYAYWTAWGLIYHGWALTRLGESELGVAKMQQGITLSRMAGGLIAGTHTLAMLAESLWLMGKHDEALGVLEEAFTHKKKKDEFCHLSQLNCLKGKWLQELEKEDDEQYFRQAIAVAKEQNAPILEFYRLPISS